MNRLSTSGLMARFSLVAALVISMAQLGYGQEGDGKTVAQDKPAQEKKLLTDVDEVLKQADAATKSVNMVRFTATYMATGPNSDRQPMIEGTGIIRDSGTNLLPQKFRYETKVRLQGSEEITEVIAASDGEHYFPLDNKAKKLHTDLDPEVMGQYGIQVWRTFNMIEFLHPTPFSDEINGKSKALKGTTKVGEEECYRVEVEYNVDATQKATWYFSVRDLLPRRVDREFPVNDGPEPRRTSFVITALEVDPVFVKNPFTIDLPDGYKKTSEFALP